MLYTAASVSTFITHICQSVGVEITCLAVCYSDSTQTISYFVIEQEVQAISIAFNLIIIRRSCSNREHDCELSVLRYSCPETSRLTVSVGVGTGDTFVEVP
jgi:hypothetical protein